jgi:hypothetical protein
MKRFPGLAAAALAGAVLAAAPAQAQMVYPYSRPNYGPGYQPQLSPYLNFLRGGDPAANYFLGTLPEFQRRANAKQFGTEINALNQAMLSQATAEPVDPLLFRPLMETGHPTAFNNTLTYFGQGTPVPGVARSSGAGYRPPGTTGYGVPSIPGATPGAPRR